MLYRYKLVLPEIWRGGGGGGGGREQEGGSKKASLKKPSLFRVKVSKTDACAL